MSYSLLDLFEACPLNVDPALFLRFYFSGSGVGKSLTSLPPSADILLVSCFSCNISWFGESLLSPRSRPQPRYLPHEWIPLLCPRPLQPPPLQTPLLERL